MLGHHIGSRVDGLLAALWQAGGTDLLLTAGLAPQFRVHGELRPVPDEPKLTGADTEALLAEVLSPSQFSAFAGQHEYDFSFSWRDAARIRGNAFTQRDQTTLALRIIPRQIPTMEQLGLPPVLEKFTQQHRAWCWSPAPPARASPPPWPR